MMGQHQCDICEKVFTASSSLIDHKRIHLGIRPYKCNVCGKTFTQSKTLEQHNRTHTGEKPYECDQCNKKFTQRSGLIRHKLSHAGIKPFKCEICHKAFTRSTTLIEHMRKHDDKGARVYECNYCNKVFNHVSNLGKHQRKLHPGTKPKYQIKDGDNLLPSKQKRVNVVLQKENKAPFITETGVSFERKIIPEPTHEEEVVTAVNSIHTDMIDEESMDSYHESYNAMEPEDHDASPVITDEAQQYYVYDDGALGSKEKLPECQYIDSTYVTGAVPTSQTPVLQYDPATGNYTQTWTIDLGGLSKELGYPTYLGYQQSLQQQSAPSYTITNQQLENAITLHSQQISTGIEQEPIPQDHILPTQGSPVKLHHCLNCTKSFTDIEQLKIHQRIHTLRTSYECSECQQIFPKAGQLIKHQQKEHPYLKKMEKLPKNVYKSFAPTKKEYKCSMCKAPFMGIGALQTHQREAHTMLSAEAVSQVAANAYLPAAIPSTAIKLTKEQRLMTGVKPYKCDFCPKAFTRSHALIEHQRQHSGIRPFKCEICLKTFAVAKTLQNHQLTHSNLKPYSCEVCGKSYTQLGSLMRHMKRHQGLRRQYKCDICDKMFTRPSGVVSHKQLIHFNPRPKAPPKPKPPPKPKGPRKSSTWASADQFLAKLPKRPSKNPFLDCNQPQTSQLIGNDEIQLHHPPDDQTPFNVEGPFDVDQNVVESILPGATDPGDEETDTDSDDSDEEDDLVNEVNFERQDSMSIRRNPHLDGYTEPGVSSQNPHLDGYVEDISVQNPHLEDYGGEDPSDEDLSDLEEELDPGLVEGGGETVVINGNKVIVTSAGDEDNCDSEVTHIFVTKSGLDVENDDPADIHQHLPLKSVQEEHEEVSHLFS